MTKKKLPAKYNLYTSEENNNLTGSEGFIFLWAQNEETTVVEVVPNESHFGIKIKVSILLTSNGMMKLKLGQW